MAASWPAAAVAAPKAATAWSAVEKEALKRYYLAYRDAAYRKLSADFTRISAEHREIELRSNTAMVVEERSDSKPSAPLLFRGMYDQPREMVEAAPPSFLPPMSAGLPANRLGLARWMVDRTNPLFARVIVNRLWQEFFGAGFVESADDFGVQARPPSHPELLDWLAVQFVESGWDVKALHRLIVTSATYRQSSAATPELLARDASNALYARGPRWRMTAEMVRDGALRASGLLVANVGGPSVKPYQPAGIWNPLNSFYNYPLPESLPSDDLHRRTLYTFVKRNAPHPGMKVFDFTNRTESVARRRSSNTPLQALELMDDPQYVEAYRALAADALRAAPDEDAQLERLYRHAARATPNPSHIAVLRDYYRGQRAAYEGNDAKIAGVLDVGVVPVDPALDRTSLAALTNVAALVMNSPDAYTVR